MCQDQSVTPPESTGTASVHESVAGSNSTRPSPRQSPMRPSGNLQRRRSTVTAPPTLPTFSQCPVAVRTCMRYFPCNGIENTAGERALLARMTPISSGPTVQEAIVRALFHFQERGGFEKYVNDSGPFSPANFQTAPGPFSRRIGKVPVSQAAKAPSAEKDTPNSLEPASSRPSDSRTKAGKSSVRSSVGEAVAGTSNLKAQLAVSTTRIDAERRFPIRTRCHRITSAGIRIGTAASGGLLCPL